MLLKLLDKLKSPALLIGVVGIIYAIGNFLQIKKTISDEVTAVMSADQIISLLIILVLFLGLGHAFLAVKRITTLLKTSRRKIIIFIAPMQEGAFYKEHFYELIEQAKAQACADLEILITYYCPMKTFQGRDPEVLLDLVDGLPVSGIFMIPASPDSAENLNGIKEFKKKFPATVLLDVSYTGDGNDFNELPNFIGGDEMKGGSLAAQLAIDYLQKVDSHTKEIKILILKGRSTEWEQQRIDSFNEAIKFHGPNICIDVTDDLYYKREKSEQYLKELHDDIFDYNIIFACNDEMAIGALAVLESLAKEDGGNIKKLPKIIGYDGTPEIKKLILENNKHILGTVDVDIQAQARKAVQTMHDLLLGRKSKVKRDLVSPKKIKNKLKNSQDHQ